MEMILGIYTNLMKQGYKIHEIDQIDPVFYFKTIGYASKAKKVYIDDIL